MWRLPTPRIGKWVAAGLLPVLGATVLVDLHVLAGPRDGHHDVFSEPLFRERVVAASCGPGLAAHFDVAASVTERPCPACLLHSVRQLAGEPIGSLGELLPAGSPDLASQLTPSQRTPDLRSSRGPPRA